MQQKSTSPPQQNLRLNAADVCPVVTMPHARSVHALHSIGESNGKTLEDLLDVRIFSCKLIRQGSLSGDTTEIFDQQIWIYVQQMLARCIKQITMTSLCCHNAVTYQLAFMGWLKLTEYCMRCYTNAVPCLTKQTFDCSA